MLAQLGNRSLATMVQPGINLHCTLFRRPSIPCLEALMQTSSVSVDGFDIFFRQQAPFLSQRGPAICPIAGNGVPIRRIPGERTAWFRAKVRFDRTLERFRYAFLFSGLKFHWKSPLPGAPKAHHCYMFLTRMRLECSCEGSLALSQVTLLRGTRVGAKGFRRTVQTDAMGCRTRVSIWHR